MVSRSPRSACAVTGSRPPCSAAVVRSGQRVRRWTLPRCAVGTEARRTAAGRARRQRKDVGARRDRFAAHLFGRRVVGREQRGPPNCVACAADAPGSCSSSLPMPKSSRRTWPAASTRMLEGFRSRWTIERECAYATARAVCSTMATRADDVGMALGAVRRRWACHRRVRARGRAGRRIHARVVEPRDVRDVRARPAGRARAPCAAPHRAMPSSTCGSLRATRRLGRPSTRSATQTELMPPRPSWRHSR